MFGSFVFLKDNKLSNEPNETFVLLNVMVPLFPKVPLNESKFLLESENDEHFHSSFNLFRKEETMSALGNTKEISYLLSG